MKLSVPLAERTQALLELNPELKSAIPVAAPGVALEGALAALARGETHYTDRPGILPLRQKVAEMLTQRYGLEADPNSIVITCGATEARFVAAQCLLAAGDGLLCLDNSDLLEGGVIIRGAKLLQVGAGLEQVKALYLTSDTDETLRADYLQKANEQGWWVIFEATNETGFHPAQDTALIEKVVTIGALGQAQGLESWRIGFFHAPSGEAPELRSFKQALTICTTSLSQYAALALLAAS